MSGGTEDTKITINVNINIMTKSTYNCQKQAAIVTTTKSKTTTLIEKESCNQEQWGRWAINPPPIRQEELMEVVLAITITTVTVTVTIYTNFHHPLRRR